MLLTLSKYCDSSGLTVRACSTPRILTWIRTPPSVPVILTAYSEFGDVYGVMEIVILLLSEWPITSASIGSLPRLSNEMEENISKQSNWTKRERKHALATLDELRRQWAEYHDERASRADNLRQFILNRLWLWCSPDKGLFPTHTMLEPSMPIYSLEIIPWALELDRQEPPWRAGWLHCPEKHPYNTVFVPCNSMVPLFLPSGSTMETVGPAIFPDPSVNSADIDPSWNIAFRGDLEEEEEEEEEGQITVEDESSLVPILPGSPALSSASNETMDLDQGSDADTHWMELA
ncbi:hypothetical protein PHMEG_00031316, partial [Phytophthora megakarya]